MGWFLSGFLVGQVIIVCILAVVSGRQEDKTLSNVADWAKKTKGIDLTPVFKEYQEEPHDKK